MAGRKLANVLTVDPIELIPVEAGGTTIDPVKIKLSGGFVQAKQFLAIGGETNSVKPGSFSGQQGDTPELEIP